jgi:hypothetical protein
MLAVDSTPLQPHQRFATDWTERAPDAKTSPKDDRLAGATKAGFPYGEPLQVTALAGEPTPVPSTGMKLGVNTGSPSSASGDAR